MAQPRRVAAITGGGSGMGRASAIALARAGFDVLLAGRDERSLREARDEISALTPDQRVVVHRADVGLPDQAESVVTAAVDALGQLDVMITAAAVFEAAPIIEMTTEQWDFTLNVCLRGTMVCAAAAARQMRAQGHGGRIVLFGSVSALQVEPYVAHYNAAKAAVVSLAQSMALEFAPYDITVNAVGPGWVRTPMSEDAIREADPASFRRINPLGRWGDPAEVADVVRYLATESPTFLNGQHILVDGGQTVVAPMP